LVVNKHQQGFLISKLASDNSLPFMSAFLLMFQLSASVFVRVKVKHSWPTSACFHKAQVSLLSDRLYSLVLGAVVLT